MGVMSGRYCFNRGFIVSGDFAVLLKAGMSAKQAVFYNLISSILCFFGMVLGIFVGDNPTSTSWVFAVSAGTFLYIGLVDMVRRILKIKIKCSLFHEI